MSSEKQKRDAEQKKRKEAQIKAIEKARIDAEEQKKIRDSEEISFDKLKHKNKALVLSTAELSPEQSTINTVAQIRSQFLQRSQNKATSAVIINKDKAAAAQKKIQEKINHAKTKVPNQIGIKQSTKTSMGLTRPKESSHYSNIEIQDELEELKKHKNVTAANSIALSKLFESSATPKGTSPLPSQKAQSIRNLAPQMPIPRLSSDTNNENTSNIQKLHYAIKSYPNALKTSQIEPSQKDNVAKMQIIAAQVRDDHPNLKDAEEFKSMGNNTWSVPEQMEDKTFTGPIFMSRFNKDGKVVMGADSKPVYDVLYYEKGKLIHEKSFIAPDNIPEGSKASVDTETRANYLKIHDTLAKEQLEAIKTQARAEVEIAITTPHATNSVPTPPQNKPAQARY